MIKNLELKKVSYDISNFLILKVHDVAQLNREEIAFFQKNRLSSLLPFTTIKKEDEIFIRYDQITDTNLATLLIETISKNQLFSFINTILESFLEIIEKGLHLQNVLLNKDYIFHDVLTNKFVFIYTPFSIHSFDTISMKGFFRELLSSVKYNEKDDLQSFIRLHNFLADPKELDNDEFIMQIKEIYQEPINITVEKSIKPEFVTKSTSNFYSPGSSVKEYSVKVENGVQTSEYSRMEKAQQTKKQLEIEEEVQYKRITRTDMDAMVQNKGTSIKIGPESHTAIPSRVIQDPEGTTVLGVFEEPEEEGTTALGVNPFAMNHPVLLLKKTGQRILLSKEIFKLGRDPKQVDYPVINQAIGRVHAEIQTVDGQYFLIDKNSRNGSFVNGMKIASNQRVKIKHEDTIKLANVEFEFQLF